MTGEVQRSNDAARGEKPREISIRDANEAPKPMYR